MAKTTAASTSACTSSSMVCNAEDVAKPWSASMARKPSNGSFRSPMSSSSAPAIVELSETRRWRAWDRQDSPFVRRGASNERSYTRRTQELGSTFGPKLAAPCSLLGCQDLENLGCEHVQQSIFWCWQRTGLGKNYSSIHLCLHLFVDGLQRRGCGQTLVGQYGPKAF